VVGSDGAVSSDYRSQLYPYPRLHDRKPSGFPCRIVGSRDPSWSVSRRHRRPETICVRDHRRELVVWDHEVERTDVRRKKEDRRTEGRSRPCWAGLRPPIPLSPEEEIRGRSGHPISHRRRVAQA
jgi:hypothetical protein